MNNDMEHLLEKYFDGQTSLREEEVLRQYFATNEIPPHLLCYRELFGYISSERSMLSAKSSNVPLNEPGKMPTGSSRWKPTGKKWAPSRWSLSIRPALISMVAAAACVVLAIGWYLFSKPLETNCPKNQSYAMIDGRCYTDQALIEHFLDQSRRTMSEAVSADPLSDQLQELNFFGDEFRNIPPSQSKQP